MSVVLVPGRRLGGCHRTVLLGELLSHSGEEVGPIGVSVAASVSAPGRVMYGGAGCCWVDGAGGCRKRLRLARKTPSFVFFTGFGCKKARPHRWKRLLRDSPEVDPGVSEGRHLEPLRTGIGRPYQGMHRLSPIGFVHVVSGGCTTHSWKLWCNFFLQPAATTTPPPPQTLWWSIL